MRRRLAWPEREPPAPPTTSKGTGNVPVTNIDFTGDFALNITSTKWVYSTDEAIDVQAALSYAGTDPSVELSPFRAGVFFFFGLQLVGSSRYRGYRKPRFPTPLFLSLPPGTT